MIEVAVIVLMFLGVGMAMRMDVSPRPRVIARHTPELNAAPAASSDNTPAKAA